MWKNGTFILEGDGIILLSEGLADRKFFTKLVKHHALPKMDFPWPVEDHEEASEDTKKFHGKSSFVNMVKALAILVKAYPDLGKKIKCVAIATDAGSDRARSFRCVRSQIENAGNFPIPDEVLEVKASANGFPAIVVMLIPIEGLGGLETLCVEAFSSANERGRKLAECQDLYFECSPAKPKGWGAESRDKAAFQCLIAASCKDNPSMPTAWAFSKRKGRPPVIDIGAVAFNEVAGAMKKIVTDVNGGGPAR